jgi:hypothetical protein
MITPLASRKTFVSSLTAIAGIVFCVSENNDALLSFEATPSELEVKM